ncbi:hypothetical protein ACHWQZ_G008991 [Mnemiopsis leidyi]
MSDDVLGHFVKFSNQTSGQDKICRVLQYSSQLVWWYLEKRGFSTSYIEQLKQLQSSLSLARKYFSLGKSVEHMRGAAVAIHINDPILRYSITLSRISSALQFLCDNVYLFSRLGLLRLDQGNLLSVSSKLWLYADLLNIIRVCYEIRHEIKEQIDRQESNIRNSKHSFYSTCKCVMVRRPDLVIDLVKNVSDVWLPVHASGLTQLSPGSVGLFGTVSSVLGAATIWQKSGKL